MANTADSKSAAREGL